MRKGMHMMELGKLARPLLAVALAAAMTFSLAGCGSDEGSAGSAGAIEPTKAAESKADLETIDESVLYDGSEDGNGIVITAKEVVDDPIYGKGLALQVENKGDKNATIQCDYVVVNGYMLTGDFFSTDVAAGKKSNDTLYLEFGALQELGMDAVGEVDVSFNIIDPDTYETLLTTPEVSVKTSAADAVQDVDLAKDGTELYNKDGVRIVGTYVDESSFWGAGIKLYLENNSDHDVVVQCDNMSVNGTMVTPYFSCRVNAGRRALSEITLMDTELEENEIDNIESAELNFVLCNPDTYETIAESGPVTFQVK